MSRSLKLILGPPGTGKTTSLLQVVERHLEEGIKPDRIAFVSFTKKAATEAVNRAKAKFGGQFRHFRTLHSTAYQALNIRRDDVMGRADYKQIAALLGVEFSGYSDPTEGINATATEGDVMLNLITYSNATGQNLFPAWQQGQEPVDWYALKQFRDTIETYKADTGKLDFDDMIKQFTQARLLVDVDVAIIDEAQDLSNAQWDMAKVAFRRAKYVYVAGDDDQAIYQWSGANVERFLRLKAERTVLPITYRLPSSIQRLAQNVSDRISDRYPKQWRPADSRPGTIERLTAVDHLEINGGTYMLLARNSYFLTDYMSQCIEQGIPYHTAKGPSVDPEHVRGIKAWERIRKGFDLSKEDMELVTLLARNRTPDTGLIWHDALRGIPLVKREYYLSILRAGRKLTDTDRVYIGTIHSSKGGEADNVVLRTDISWRTSQAFEQTPDPEHRVFYVGVTRARNTLQIIDPQGTEKYQI